MTNLIDHADRIFVAGHRGMAGSAIVRRLSQAGYVHLLTANHDELDLRDAGATATWMERQRPDVVVLAAAKVGGIQANSTYPADFLLDNLKIQNNVIESAWRFGAKRLLFLGSSCIYPKFAPQPIQEESLLTGSLEPTNEWYAIAKITGIQLCRALRQQHGFDAISVRDGVPTVTCWGTGSPRREFLHVDDLADAAMFCLEHWQPAADELQFLNVGTGTDLPIGDLAGLVADAVGFRGTLNWDASKPDGTPRKLLDVNRLKALGWSATISLEEGLRATVNDYVQRQSNGQEVRL
jgi:GDP-L-fucose synthase